MQKRYKRNVLKYWRFTKITLFIGLPLILIILPADYFDHGQSISLFELMGFEDYYSKGLTRGCQHLIHLEFGVAASYNKLAFVALPIIISLWAMAFWRNYKIVRKEYFGNKLQEIEEVHDETEQAES